jgi:hypothetical protein
VGAQVGSNAWSFARSFFDGSVTNTATQIAARKLDAGNVELRFNAKRGLFYKVLTATDVTGPYTNSAPGQVAYETFVGTTNAIGGPQKYYRITSSLAP